MGFTGDDDGFSFGFGSGFGTGMDPRRGEGPAVTRGVMREPSRVRRTHPDDASLHPVPPQQYGHPGFQQGYGQYERGVVQGTDMGLGEVADRGPHYGKGPKGYRRSDERIREEACERISRQGWVDASDVDVQVENAVVLLTGTVATRDDKRGLELMLDRVHGVEEVRTELRLRRATAPQTQPQTPTRAAGEPVSSRSFGATRENGRTPHS